MVSENCIRRTMFRKRAAGCDCPINEFPVCPYTKACATTEWYLSEVLKACKKAKEDK